MQPTLLFRLYRGVSALVLPFAAMRQVNRIRRLGFTAYRAHERLGHATAERRLGKLIWIHGASVGETKSALQLVARLRLREVQVLLTSGTGTSAQAVAGRLPDGAVHQFAPLDGLGPIRRFLDHWRPDLAVFVESELWPNLLSELAERSVPTALVNARLSDRSAERWHQVSDTAHYVLRGIQWAHCQDQRTCDHLQALGLGMAHTGVNLKSVQGPPLISSAELSRAKRWLGDRPVWVAASTHDGEEAIVLDAHRAALRRFPDLLLILVPRHPERADRIIPLISARGMAFAQRSRSEEPEWSHQVYLADTMGETDLWYTLAPVIFLGGSLVPVGGHTPFEPAAAGAAILHGPLYANFSEVYSQFSKKDASIEVHDDDTLSRELVSLLENPQKAIELGQRAKPLALSNLDALDDLATALMGLTNGD